MSILEILLLGIGLSMDAFAVSICKGLSAKRLQTRHYLIIGAWFGGIVGAAVGAADPGRDDDPQRHVGSGADGGQSRHL